MPYASWTDLQKHLDDSYIKQLSDDVAGTNPNTALINTVLIEAGDFADTYIGMRYVVPLSAPVHTSVRLAVCRIARYLLYARRKWTIDEAVDRDYRHALDWLKGVSEGDVSIPGALTAGTVEGEFGADDQLFTSTTMGGF